LLTGNRFNLGGEWEALSIKVPVRFHYQPSDVRNVTVSSDDRQQTKVTAAFTKQRKTPPVKKRRTYPWYPRPKAAILFEMMYMQGEGATRYFSKNFLEGLSSTPPANPEPVGPAVADLAFSQEVASEQEVFTATFNLYNPSKYKLIEDVNLEVVVTDAALDENGRLPEGARVYNHQFNIKPILTLNGVAVPDDSSANGVTALDNSIVFGMTVPDNGAEDDSDKADGFYDDWVGNAVYGMDLLPESKLSVLWQLNADPGLAESRTFNDELDKQIFDMAEHLQNASNYMSYIHYSFILDGQKYEGYTRGKTITIEPQPKLFVSYALEQKEGDTYDLIVKATNAGLGTARNVNIGMPSIPPIGSFLRTLTLQG